MDSYRELMYEANQTYKDFKNEWNNWRNGKIKLTKKKDSQGSLDLEPRSESFARDKFLKR